VGGTIASVVSVVASVVSVDPSVVVAAGAASVVSVASLLLGLQAAKTRPITKKTTSHLDLIFICFLPPISNGDPKASRTRGPAKTG
jgi:hypothetical protein